jgi:hypothetical protein
MPILSTKGAASASGFGGVGAGAGGGAELYDFAVGTSFTFDHGGRNGPVGPASYSQAGYNASTYPWVADSNILSFPTAGYSNGQGSLNGVQKWMVPATGTYRFLMRGASSTHAHYSGQRSNYYGRGAEFQAEVDLEAGVYLGIIVGQLPINTGNWTYTYPGQAAPSGADLFVGGGGASHVWYWDTYTPIFSAGAGGSNRTNYPSSPSQTARTTVTVGDTSSPSNGGGNGGSASNGNGGTGSQGDGGTSGAGFFSGGDGVTNYYQRARHPSDGGFGAYGINIPNPSTVRPHGGLGGGGAGGWGGSAGGGGYSGGGAGTNSGNAGYGGGGSNYAIAGSTVLTSVSQSNGGGTVVVTRMS